MLLFVLFRNVMLEAKVKLVDGFIILALLIFVFLLLTEDSPPAGRAEDCLPRHPRLLLDLSSILDLRLQTQAEGSCPVLSVSKKLHFYTVNLTSPYLVLFLKHRKMSVACALCRWLFLLVVCRATQLNMYKCCFFSFFLLKHSVNT